jgi:uncharacterized protein
MNCVLLVLAVFLSAESPLPLSAEHPNFPRGHTLAGYRDCGSGHEMAGVPIQRLHGENRVYPDAEGPPGTAAADKARVEFSISGLEKERKYILGFTWRDAGDAGRRQSVALAAGEDGAREMVLPPSVPAAFDAGKSVPARILLPLSEKLVSAGAFRVAFVNEAGPDAVVNEIWLLKKTDSAARKRILIVTGDDYPGHRWRETAPVLADILRKDPRLEVSITESPSIYGSPLIAHYDATVLHFKDYTDRMPLDERVYDGFAKAVKGGQGLVLAHFGCGAFQEWPGFVEIAGRVWNPQLRGHDPHGPFEVRIADPDHPVAKDMRPFTITDELYTCLDGEPPIHVVFEAASKVDDKVYPIGFVPAKKTGGRVFNCVLGHDVTAFETPEAAELYRRAAAWAAGLPPE